MPGPSDQNLLWMFAGAGRIGMESLDYQVKGGGPDGIEIPVNTGSIPHFVGRPVQICQTDIFRHADTSSLQKLTHRKFVNEKRIGLIAIEPVAKFRHIDIFARDKRLAAVFFRQSPLPIEKGRRPKVI